MPPKNKATSKKPAKTRTPTLINGLTKEEMSKEQLENHILHLRAELDKEREERNYFQLERDKIHTFREITDRQLEEVKAELKNLDKEIEEDERRHQVEIKVYKQKMKHLLCEHQNTISELKADGLVSGEAVQKEKNQLETKLHNEMRAVMVDMQELDNKNLVKELELKHNEDMTKTRDTWEKHLTEIKAKYGEKMKVLQQELNNMRKNVISEAEDDWNSHITGLIDIHKKAFSEATELVHLMEQDLNVNSSLKTHIKEVKMKIAEKEKDLNRVLQDNTQFKATLSKLKAEIAETEKKMNYRGMKKDTDEKIKHNELKDLKKECEELEEKFSMLQQERDELYKTYTQNIEKVQHQADVKNTLLERKLTAMTDSLEKTQAQLNSVVSASNMDQTALAAVTKKMEEKLDSYNYCIKDLQYKKAQISKAHKDLLLTFKARQRALGVPVEELGLKPFENSPAGKSLGQDFDLGIQNKKQVI
ncbi:dynein regulatory complex subunit 4-like isoform X1 [Mastacembelus armatus]|uniref:Dynein regulatory complex subunit 4 n=1 Tax=Mastacembelus armatus TaxID=205130 RepID=A0A3Q3NFF7_9TELE|nr:dynein regulatory complex subunit 4-like isoform X1 [Mastacembelus armatus]